MKPTNQVIWAAIISVFGVIAGAAIGILPSLYKDDVSKDRIDLKENVSIVNVKPPFQLDSHFYPSGWMGDGEYGTKYLRIANSVKLVTKQKMAVVTLSYNPGPNEWAGVYWQYPDSNWGQEAGKNINEANEIIFLARGRDGGEIVEFKSGGIRGKYIDNHDVSLGKVVLTRNWKLFRIDLTNEDLSGVIGAFACVFTATPTKKEIVIQVANLSVK